MPAKIIYNDTTIASVSPGQTATVNIKGSVPQSQLVVDLSGMNATITYNGAIDLSNIPEVESLEVTDTSHTAVRYNGNIYLLMEGEING